MGQLDLLFSPMNLKDHLYWYYCLFNVHFKPCFLFKFPVVVYILHMLHSISLSGMPQADGFPHCWKCALHLCWSFVSMYLGIQLLAIRACRSFIFAIWCHFPQCMYNTLYSPEMGEHIIALHLCCTWVLLNLVISTNLALTTYHLRFEFAFPLTDD